MCTCVKAIENARDAALPSRYLRTSASAVVAIGGDAGGERDAHERAGRQPHAIAQRRHRIEHGAGRARQRAAVERDRVGGDRPRPRNRARSVSHSTAPPSRPSTPSTWKAQAALRRRCAAAG